MPKRASTPATPDAPRRRAARTAQTAAAEAPAPAKRAIRSRTQSGAATKPSAARSRAADPGKNLIIVESPAKARTIERYLGPDFKVMASVGHVVDLPTNKLGVDIEHDFKPEYVVIKGKGAVLEALRRQARVSRKVFLAPDPDREGEAIAFHIAQKLRDVNPEIHRATFNEITKRAVQEGIAHPRPINENLFNAQQARRVLDRLVGYKLSPLLWQKVQRGLSAGRVQSVAVKLICDREREIKRFKPEEYWTIDGRVAADAPPPFDIRLAKVDGEKAEIPNEAAARQIIERLQGKPFVVAQVIKKEVAKRPFPPFITSTLQQEASRKLRLTAARTMRLAQQLYEGVELGELGMVGLITYMRTDSTRLADEAVHAIREQVGALFGPQYVPPAPRVYAGRKGAQDAHEAIRPTDIRLTPERLKPYLDPPLLALYTLIWRRAMACQMSDARVERTRVEVEADGCQFVAHGSVVVFDGYLRVYQEARDETGRTESDVEGAEPVQLEDDEPLPPLEAGQRLEVLDLKGSQHFTQPPPRFTEAGLIKELERQGIGRPSTYAAIISTIQDKKYVVRESGTFHPTELGFMVTDLLTESFPHIMDVKFTAAMEDQLDRVEEGEEDWVKLVRTFYTPFAQLLEQASVHMRTPKAEEIPTEHVCDRCGRPMVLRWGRNGRFLACSGYPECRNTKQVRVDEQGHVEVEPEEQTDRTCPTCGRPMKVRTGRSGRFLACTGYPECKTTQPYAIGVPCPREGCDGELVERRSQRGLRFYSCNRYPACRFSVFEKPYTQRCDTCGEARYFIGEGPRKKVLCCRKDDCAFPRVQVRVDD